MPGLVNPDGGSPQDDPQNAPPVGLLSGQDAMGAVLGADDQQPPKYKEPDSTPPPGLLGDSGSGSSAFSPAMTDLGVGAPSNEPWMPQAPQAPDSGNGFQPDMTDLGIGQPLVTPDQPDHDTPIVPPVKVDQVEPTSALSKQPPVAHQQSNPFQDYWNQTFGQATSQNPVSRGLEAPIMDFIPHDMVKSAFNWMSDNKNNFDHWFYGKDVQGTPDNPNATVHQNGVLDNIGQWVQKDVLSPIETPIATNADKVIDASIQDPNINWWAKQLVALTAAQSEQGMAQKKGFDEGLQEHFQQYVTPEALTNDVRGLVRSMPFLGNGYGDNVASFIGTAASDIVNFPVGTVQFMFDAAHDPVAAAGGLVQTVERFGYNAMRLAGGDPTFTAKDGNDLVMDGVTLLFLKQGLTHGGKLSARNIKNVLLPASPEGWALERGIGKLRSKLGGSGVQPETTNTAGQTGNREQGGQTDQTNEAGQVRSPSQTIDIHEAASQDRQADRGAVASADEPVRFGLAEEQRVSPSEQERAQGAGSQLPSGTVGDAGQHLGEQAIRSLPPDLQGHYRELDQRAADLERSLRTGEPFVDNALRHDAQTGEPAPPMDRAEMEQEIKEIRLRQFQMLPMNGDFGDMQVTRGTFDGGRKFGGSVGESVALGGDSRGFSANFAGFPDQEGLMRSQGLPTGEAWTARDGARSPEGYAQAARQAVSADMAKGELGVDVSHIKFGPLEGGHGGFDANNPRVISVDETSLPHPMDMARSAIGFLQHAEEIERNPQILEQKLGRALQPGELEKTVADFRRIGQNMSRARYADMVRHVAIHEGVHAFLFRILGLKRGASWLDAGVAMHDRFSKKVWQNLKDGGLGDEAHAIELYVTALEKAGDISEVGLTEEKAVLLEKAAEAIFEHTTNHLMPRFGAPMIDMSAATPETQIRSQYGRKDWSAHQQATEAWSQANAYRTDAVADDATRRAIDERPALRAAFPASRGTDAAAADSARVVTQVRAAFDDLPEASYEEPSEWRQEHQEAVKAVKDLVKKFESAGLDTGEVQSALEDWNSIKRGDFERGEDGHSDFAGEMESARDETYSALEALLDETESMHAAEPQAERRGGGRLADDNRPFGHLDAEGMDRLIRGANDRLEDLTEGTPEYDAAVKRLDAILDERDLQNRESGDNFKATPEEVAARTAPKAKATVKAKAKAPEPVREDPGPNGVLHSDLIDALNEKHPNLRAHIENDQVRVGPAYEDMTKEQEGDLELVRAAVKNSKEADPTATAFKADMPTDLLNDTSKDSDFQLLSDLRSSLPIRGAYARVDRHGAQFSPEGAMDMERPNLTVPFNTRFTSDIAHDLGVTSAAPLNPGIEKGSPEWKSWLVNRAWPLMAPHMDARMLKKIGHPGAEPERVGSPEWIKWNSAMAKLVEPRDVGSEEWNRWLNTRIEVLKDIANKYAPEALKKGPTYDRLVKQREVERGVIEKSIKNLEDNQRKYNAAGNTKLTAARMAQIDSNRIKLDAARKSLRDLDRKWQKNLEKKKQQWDRLNNTIGTFNSMLSGNFAKKDRPRMLGKNGVDEGINAETLTATPTEQARTDALTNSLDDLSNAMRLTHRDLMQALEISQQIEGPGKVHYPRMRAESEEIASQQRAQIPADTDPATRAIQEAAIQEEHEDRMVREIERTRVEARNYSKKYAELQQSYEVTKQLLKRHLAEVEQRAVEERKSWRKTVADVPSNGPIKSEDVMTPDFVKGELRQRVVVMDPSLIAHAVSAADMEAYRKSYAEGLEFFQQAQAAGDEAMMREGREMMRPSFRDGSSTTQAPVGLGETGAIMDRHWTVNNRMERQLVVNLYMDNGTRLVDVPISALHWAADSTPAVQEVAREPWRDKKTFTRLLAKNGDPMGSINNPGRSNILGFLSGAQDAIITNLGANSGLIDLKRALPGEGQFKVFALPQMGGWDGEKALVIRAGHLDLYQKIMDVLNLPEGPRRDLAYLQASGEVAPKDIVATLDREYGGYDGVRSAVTAVKDFKGSPTTAREAADIETSMPSIFDIERYVGALQSAAERMMEHIQGLASVSPEDRVAQYSILSSRLKQLQDENERMGGVSSARNMTEETQIQNMLARWFNSDGTPKTISDVVQPTDVAWLKDIWQTPEDVYKDIEEYGDLERRSGETAPMPGATHKLYVELNSILEDPSKTPAQKAWADAQLRSHFQGPDTPGGVPGTPLEVPIATLLRALEDKFKAAAEGWTSDPSVTGQVGVDDVASRNAYEAIFKPLMNSYRFHLAQSGADKQWVGARRATIYSEIQKRFPEAARYHGKDAVSNLVKDLRGDDPDAKRQAQHIMDGLGENARLGLETVLRRQVLHSRRGGRTGTGGDSPEVVAANLGRKLEESRAANVTQEPIEQRVMRRQQDWLNAISQALFGNQRDRSPNARDALNGFITASSRNPRTGERETEPILRRIEQGENGVRVDATPIRDALRAMTNRGVHPDSMKRTVAWLENKYLSDRDSNLYKVLRPKLKALKDVFPKVKNGTEDVAATDAMISALREHTQLDRDAIARIQKAVIDQRIANAGKDYTKKLDAQLERTAGNSPEHQRLEELRPKFMDDKKAAFDRETDTWLLQVPEYVRRATWETMKPVWEELNKVMDGSENAKLIDDGLAKAAKLTEKVDPGLAETAVHSDLASYIPELQAIVKKWREARGEPTEAEKEEWTKLQGSVASSRSGRLMKDAKGRAMTDQAALAHAKAVHTAGYRDMYYSLMTTAKSALRDAIIETSNAHFEGRKPRSYEEIRTQGALRPDWEKIKEASPWKVQASNEGDIGREEVQGHIIDAAEQKKLEAQRIELESQVGKLRGRAKTIKQAKLDEVNRQIASSRAGEAVGRSVGPVSTDTATSGVQPELASTQQMGRLNTVRAGTTRAAEQQRRMTGREAQRQRTDANSGRSKRARVVAEIVDQPEEVQEAELNDHAIELRINGLQRGLEQAKAIVEFINNKTGVFSVKIEPIGDSWKPEGGYAITTKGGNGNHFMITGLVIDGSKRGEIAKLTKQADMQGGQSLAEYLKENGVSLIMNWDGKKKSLGTHWVLDHSHVVQDEETGAPLISHPSKLVRDWSPELRQDAGLEEEAAPETMPEPRTEVRLHQEARAKGETPAKPPARSKILKQTVRDQGTSPGENVTDNGAVTDKAPVEAARENIDDPDEVKSLLAKRDQSQTTQITRLQKLRAELSAIQTALDNLEEEQVAAGKPKASEPAATTKATTRASQVKQRAAEKQAAALQARIDRLAARQQGGGGGRGGGRKKTTGGSGADGGQGGGQLGAIASSFDHPRWIDEGNGAFEPDTHFDKTTGKFVHDPSIAGQMAKPFSDALSDYEKGSMQYRALEATFRYIHRLTGVYHPDMEGADGEEILGKALAVSTATKDLLERELALWAEAFGRDMVKRFDKAIEDLKTDPRALSRLPEKEQRLAALWKSRYDVHGSLGLRAGILDESLENYLPHIFYGRNGKKWGDSDEARGQMRQPGSVFAQGITRMHHALKTEEGKFTGEWQEAYATRKAAREAGFIVEEDPFKNATAHGQGMIDAMMNDQTAYLLETHTPYKHDGKAVPFMIDSSSKTKVPEGFKYRPIDNKRYVGKLVLDHSPDGARSLADILESDAPHRVNRVLRWWTKMIGFNKLFKLAVSGVHYFNLYTKALGLSVIHSMPGMGRMTGIFSPEIRDSDGRVIKGRGLSNPRPDLGARGWLHQFNGMLADGNYIRSQMPELYYEMLKNGLNTTRAMENLPDNMNYFVGMNTAWGKAINGFQYKYLWDGFRQPLATGMMYEVMERVRAKEPRISSDPRAYQAMMAQASKLVNDFTGMPLRYAMSRSWNQWGRFLFFAPDWSRSQAVTAARAMRLGGIFKKSTSAIGYHDETDIEKHFTNMYTAALMKGILLLTATQVAAMAWKGWQLANSTNVPFSQGAVQAYQDWTDAVSTDPRRFFDFIWGYDKSNPDGSGRYHYTHNPFFGFVRELADPVVEAFAAGSHAYQRAQQVPDHNGIADAIVAGGAGALGKISAKAQDVTLVPFDLALDYELERYFNGSGSMNISKDTAINTQVKSLNGFLPFIPADGGYGDAIGKAIYAWQRLVNPVLEQPINPIQAQNPWSLAKSFGFDAPGIVGAGIRALSGDPGDLPDNPMDPGGFIKARLGLTDIYGHDRAMTDQGLKTRQDLMEMQQDQDRLLQLALKTWSDAGTDPQKQAQAMEELKSMGITPADLTRYVAAQEKKSGGSLSSNSAADFLNNKMRSDLRQLLVNGSSTAGVNYTHVGNYKLNNVQAKAYEQAVTLNEAQTLSWLKSQPDFKNMPSDQRINLQKEMVQLTHDMVRLQVENGITGKQAVSDEAIRNVVYDTYDRQKTIIPQLQQQPWYQQASFEDQQSMSDEAQTVIRHAMTEWHAGKFGNLDEPSVDQYIKGTIMMSGLIRQTLANTSSYQEVDPIQQQKLVAHYTSIGARYMDAAVEHKTVKDLGQLQAGDVLDLMSETINQEENAKSLLQASPSYLNLPPDIQNSKMNSYLSFARQIAILKFGEQVGISHGLESHFQYNVDGLLEAKLLGDEAYMALKNNFGGWQLLDQLDGELSDLQKKYSEAAPADISPRQLSYQKKLLTQRYYQLHPELQAFHSAKTRWLANNQYGRLYSVMSKNEYNVALGSNLVQQNTPDDGGAVALDDGSQG